MIDKAVTDRVNALLLSVKEQWPGAHFNEDAARALSSVATMAVIRPHYRAELVSSLEADNAKLRYMLGRYLREVPLGHQPHMLAHLAEEALAQKPHKWADPADYAPAAAKGE